MPDAGDVAALPSEGADALVEQLSAASAGDVVATERLGERMVDDGLHDGLSCLLNLSVERLPVIGGDGLGVDGFVVLG